MPAAGRHCKRATPGRRSTSPWSTSIFNPTLPAVETLTMHTTCTNRDLPGKLPFGGDSGDFELEGRRPVVADPLPEEAHGDHPPAAGRGRPVAL